MRQTVIPIPFRSAATALSLALVSVSAQAQTTINAGETLTTTGTVNYGPLTNSLFGIISVFGCTMDATSIVNNGTFNFTGGTLSVDSFTGNLNSTSGTLRPGVESDVVLGTFTTITNQQINANWN